MQKQIISIFAALKTILKPHFGDMYAIVNIAGQQLKVEKDQQLYINRVAEKEGENIRFDEVLLVDNDGKVSVGAPAVSGAAVTAKVVEHLKGDKVIVFKKKRRKGYQTRNGHRQLLTKIAIEGISINGKEAQSKKAEKSAEEKPKAEAKPKKEAAEAPAQKAEKAEKAATKAEKPAAKAETAKTDDLKMIEGIGPKTEEVLNEAGINSFSELASTSVDKLKELLEAAGPAYASHAPDTWPDQAKLAADGKFDELKEMQEKLEGGVDKG